MRIDGDALRRARFNRALSQSELAVTAGVARNTVARLENERVGGVEPATLRKIAAALGVEPGTLIDWTSEDGGEDRPKSTGRRGST